MTRRRTSPDGLPFRVYQRFGSRVYSIGYKSSDGSWAFRLQCAVSNKANVAETRREAVRRAMALDEVHVLEGTFAALADLWLKRQHALPPTAPGKRAATTIRENERELANLKAAFGHLRVSEMEKSDAYVYLDACQLAVDRKGDPRPRPAKSNKEIALARVILEYGVRTKLLKANPFDGFERLPTHKRDRLVSDQELLLALELGRRMGAPQHIVALALKTAWLCVRRSVEVRALTRDQITGEGMVWQAAKRQRGEAVKVGLIKWSDELRSTVQEALGIKRNCLAASWYVFGNLSGQRYTKGGWKATLSRLMAACVQEAAVRGLPFLPFSLQDCRPKGVSDKLAAGHDDTQDATMHGSERMLRQVYDRRRVRVAKPTR